MRERRGCLWDTSKALTSRSQDDLEQSEGDVVSVVYHNGAYHSNEREVATKIINIVMS
jgi:hypothetical protein